MHRSLSYYTLGKHHSGHHHAPLELAGAVSPASPGGTAAASSSMLPPPLAQHGMPRSLSLQRINYGAGSPGSSAHNTPFASSNHSTPFATAGQHSRGPSLQHFATYVQQSPSGPASRLRNGRVVSTTSVEVLDDAADEANISTPAAQRASSEPKHALPGVDASPMSRRRASATAERDDENDDPLANSCPHEMLLNNSSSPSSTSTASPSATPRSPLQLPRAATFESQVESPELRACVPQNASRPISIASSASKQQQQQQHGGARYDSPSSDLGSSVPSGASLMLEPVSARAGNAIVHPPPTIRLGSSVDNGDSSSGYVDAGSFSSSLLFGPHHPSSSSSGGGGGADAPTLASSLPASLIEDFDVVGRAGDNNTCDSWIVRSKFSGKMAVFKPRAGEIFEEKKRWEEAESERLEKEKRLARSMKSGMLSKASGGNSSGNSGGSSTAPSALSTSCPLPNPLSLPMHLRTPVKRGVLYGETTRKEVAAYLMDHEHFAGVPKTLEATIWLQQHEAPRGAVVSGSNGGRNGSENGLMEDCHPYLHQARAHGQNMLLQQSSSPALGPQHAHAPPPTRLLLQAPTISPALQPQTASSAAVDPPPAMFSFDAEDENGWMGSAALGSGDSQEVPQGRSLFGASGARASIHSEEDDYGEQLHHQLAPPILSPPNGAHNVMLAPPRMPAAGGSSVSNLHPPTLLSPPSSASTLDATAANAASPLPPAPDAFQSPDLVPLATAGSTPEDISSLGLGLGLPASTSALIATYGSLQEYVENGGSAEDMGSSIFSADDVHRIGILDVRLLNLDRHLGNLLVQRDEAGAPHLVPIDHGFILPAYTELSDVHLEWTYWRQCAEPFSPSTLKYIARLDPIADAAKLRNLGIRDEALVSMVFSSLLLQHAAKEGLNLFHIASMVQRDGDGEGQSTLETIVARVLGFQQQQHSESPGSDTGDERGHFDFGSPIPPLDVHTNLHSVVEEEPSGASSPSSSSLHRPGSVAPASSPPLSPGGHEAPPPSTSPMPGLLTRAQSDGAQALAEALSRQSSAPALSSKGGGGDPSTPTTPCSARLPNGEPSLRKRRSSVADAAKQLIELVDSTNAATLNSPAPVTPASAAAHAPSPAPYSTMFSSSADQATGNSTPEMPVPPPAQTLRLGTGLAYHQSGMHAHPPHAARSSSETGGPSSPSSDGLPASAGAKLQHLLHVTETVIKEELALYRARHGLLPAAPAPTSAAPSPTKPAAAVSPDSQHSSSGNGASGPSPRSGVIFNNSMRPPPSPLRNGPFSPARAVSADAADAASPSASPSSSLASSLRRARSASTEAAIVAATSPAAAARHIGSPARSARSPLHQASSPSAASSASVDSAADVPFSSPLQVRGGGRHALAAALARAAHAAANASASPTEITAES